MHNPFPSGFLKQDGIPNKLLHLNMACDSTRKNVVSLSSRSVQTAPEPTLFGGNAFVYYGPENMTRVNPTGNLYTTSRSWTIDMWFYNPGTIPSTCSFWTIAQPGNDDYNNTMLRQDAGELKVQLMRNGSIVGEVAAAYALPTGWVHMATTFNVLHGAHRVYINGALIVSGIAGKSGFFTTSGSEIIIGNGSGYSYGNWPDTAPWSFPEPSMIKAFRFTEGLLWTEAFTAPLPPYDITDDTKVMIYGFGDVLGRHTIYTSSNLYKYAEGSGVQVTPYVSKWGSSLELNRTYANTNWYDSIHTDASDDFEFDADFTIELWVQMKTLSHSDQWIWNIGNTGLGLMFNSAALRAYVNGAYFTVNPVEALTYGKWYHIAFVRGTDDVVRCAINGVFVTNTITQGGVLGASSNLVLGASAPNATTGNSSMFIDELVVWESNVYRSDFTPRDRPW